MLSHYLSLDIMQYSENHAILFVSKSLEQIYAYSVTDESTILFRKIKKKERKKHYV